MNHDDAAACQIAIQFCLPASFCVVPGIYNIADLVVLVHPLIYILLDFVLVCFYFMSSNSAFICPILIPKDWWNKSSDYLYEW